jgi:hypothetical protein
MYLWAAVMAVMAEAGVQQLMAQDGVQDGEVIGLMVAALITDPMLVTMHLQWYMRHHQ